MSYVIYQVSSCYGIPSHQSSNLWASKCLIGFNLDNSIRINEPYHNWNCSNNHCFIFLFNNIKSPECILLHWRIIIYCPEHWTTPTYYLELCNELANKENRRVHFPVSLLFFFPSWQPCCRACCPLPTTTSPLVCHVRPKLHGQVFKTEWEN